MDIVGIKKFFRFLPSLITFCSMICGLWAIYIIFTGQNITIAVCLVLFSAVFDAFDGRVARFFGVSGDFGAELDSLVDFFSFGITPMIVYFSYYNSEWSNYFTTFAILMLFPICMACRLARFNVMINEKENREVLNFKRKFFFGLPAPAGALALLLPISLEVVLEKSLFHCPCMYIIYAIVIACMLVLPIPMLSPKNLHFGFNNKRDLFFTSSVVVLVLLFFKQQMLSLIIVVCGYIITIPYSVFKYKQGIEKLNGIQEVR